MALFFDAAWFDRKLAEHGLTRADAARALGLSETETAELWKDQREVLPRHVRILALLLGEPEEEVRKRAGVQGPPLATGGRSTAGGPPGAQAETESSTARRLDDFEARLTRIEELLARLTGGKE